MMAAVTTLWLALPAWLRGGLVAVALAQAAMRIAMAFAVEAFVRGGARALVLTLGTGVAWTVISTIRSALRHRVRTALFHASAAALLHGDVSAAPREGESPHAVLAAVFEGERVVADALPMIVAEGVAVVVLGGVAVQRLPGALVAVVAAAAVVALGLLVVLRRSLVSAQDAANRAQRALFARWLESKEGASEIAAAALEDAHLARLDAAAASWLRATSRVELGSSLLGRGPMAALALALGTLTWWRLGQGTNGLALTGFLAASAAPLAALSTVLGELGRTLGRAEPLVHRLTLPRRLDAAHLVAAPGAALEAAGLAASYGGDGVFDALTFRWERGIPLVPEGPNGSGKTTLLRTLVGLLPLREGSLRWRSSSGGLAARLPVAFLPQRAHLAQESTVRDALRMLAPDAGDDAMLEATARVGLRERLASQGLDTLVGTLSVGQRQRLALARILLVNAEMVVLDEPDANLDKQGRALIDELVRELARDRYVAIVAHGDLSRPAPAEVVPLEARATESSTPSRS